MARKPKPPKEPTSPPPPPPEDKVDPRVFVIEVTADDPHAAEGEKKVIGYAIAEQVAFLDVSAPAPPGLAKDDADLIGEGVGALFRALGARSRTFTAMAIPAEKDPHGGGYRMLTSAGKGTSAGGGGGPHN